MYTFDSKVRYSEIDTDGKLSLLSLVSYFQDCSNFQSTELGMDVEALKANNRAWVLAGWQIEIDCYPKLGEKIKVGTFATGVNGLYAHRNFVMYDHAGALLAKADSIWVLLDLGSGRPIRPTEADVAAYGIFQALEMRDEGKKIKKAAKLETLPTFTVKKKYLDTHKHVNNVKYIEMALDYISEDMDVRQLRVEYKKSALYGDVVFPKVAEESHRTVVELCDGKRAYAVLEFQAKEKRNIE
ncbi:MAG: thioesterase [Lachnospiraceae bacterium]|nr:thioesterase [Lachnospiraceae bacterium]